MKMFAARTARTACMLFALSAFAGGAAAATYTVDTSASPFTPGTDNQGYWSTTLINNDTNANYAVGYSGSSSIRNFFSFNLAALNLTNQQVASATLQLRRFGYTGTDLNETVAFYDVSTPAATLNNNTGVNAGIFNDLGSGASYGSVTVAQAGTTSEMISVSLNGAALADITAVATASGYFSIGGSCLTCTAGQNVFSVSGSTGIQALVIETIPAVPEPGTYAMLGIGLGALAFLRRRKAAQARND
jgi:hypothetical protein